MASAGGRAHDEAAGWCKHDRHSVTKWSRGSTAACCGARRRTRYRWALPDRQFVVGPGHIRDAGFTPSLIIGELDNRSTDRIVSICELFRRAGLEIKIAADIEVALWMKFLFIASFSGVGAVANAPAGVLRSDPKWRGQMLAAMEEIYELAHRRGVKLPPDSIANVMAAVNGLPEEATSSMQRDIIAGKPSELESQTGAVIRMAQETNVDVPTHALIYTTLKPFDQKARATL